MIVSQPKFDGRFLCIGRSVDLPAFAGPIIAQDAYAVTATAPTIADLQEPASEISARHDFVLFETAATDEDLAALERLVGATAGNTLFIALTDDDMPMARARRLIDAGATEVFPISIAAETLAAALDRHAKREQRSAENEVSAKQGDVLSVVQTRGGAGATTVAVNLGISLLNLGRSRKSEPARVLILDLDLQFGTVGAYLDVEDNGAFLELLASAELPSTRDVLAAVQSTSFGVDVVTSPAVFVPLTSMTPELTRHLIEVYRGAYDYVIIDTPRATLDWIEPAITAATRLILVSDGSVPCIRHAKRLLDLFRETSVTLPIELLINRERKRLFASPTQREAESVLELKVSAWIPDNPRAERRAIDLGRPSGSGRSPSRNVYRKIVRSLFGRPGKPGRRN